MFINQHSHQIPNGVNFLLKEPKSGIISVALQENTTYTATFASTQKSLVATGLLSRSKWRVSSAKVNDGKLQDDQVFQEEYNFVITAIGYFNEWQLPD